ncbi:hypothetical protein LTR91_025100 [Friedmanniomyces endolithicus]|uniref:Uncharacterized protein n=2 Tax=Friedmanniomyces endolithicus TaxID=329885 RepID=A0AAN6H0D0_9PEZI|nr:hypothetical protein LTR91_025100 [Friedmanniomyces endolithicus]KAK1029398.1 hypothetical protein LTS16_019728 [Friedmanniomyces endolithicus]
MATVAEARRKTSRRRPSSVTMERVVRRADLHSPARIPDLEPELDAIRHLKKVDDFHYVTKPTEDLRAGDPEEDLDFRLFAAVNAAGGVSAANKIRLRSPTPQTTAAGFVVPERDWRYYFADTLETGEDKEDYARAALSGAQVLALSRKSWPGSAYEWKVVHVPPTRGSLSTGPVLAKDRERFKMEAATRRKRPGKKSRIKIRTKLAVSRVDAEKQQAEAANSQAKAVARETADREKRVRTNRAKKLKRRAQEKAKKGGVKGDGTDSDDGD